MPLGIHAKKISIKNWLRVANHNKANEIIMKSYDHALAQNLSWPIEKKSALSNIGMMESFINPGHDDNLHIKAFQRMCDIFHQEAFEYLRKEDSKLRTYSHPFCINKIEDELHFPLECTPFVERRTKFFQNIRNVNILYLNKIDKFVTLMTNINVIPQTALYITQTMHVRGHLLKSIKRIPNAGAKVCLIVIYNYDLY